MRLQWIGQHARAKSVNAGDIELFNGYAEVEEHKQGKSMLTVYRSPGLKLWQTLPGAGPVRGLFFAGSNQRGFAIQGAQLFEVFSNGTSLLRGTLLTTAGPVQLEENGVALTMVDGQARYSLTYSSNAFAQDNDVDYPAASRVGFIDQRFIFLKPNSQEFAWSDLLSTDVQALSFARAEGRPDLLVSMQILHREVWLFGTETTQPFYSTGDPTAPFAPIGSVFIHQGCAAPQSPAIVGETLCWLGRNQEGHRQVLQATGQNVQRVSTHAMEEEIATYAVVTDAIAWSNQIEGHLNYNITFPTTPDGL